MPYRSPVVLKKFGCSLPVLLVEQVDALRGDVNRSRYIQRLIEKNVNAIQSEEILAGASRSASSTKGKGGNPKPNG